MCTDEWDEETEEVSEGREETGGSGSQTSGGNQGRGSSRSNKVVNIGYSGVTVEDSDVGGICDLSPKGLVSMFGPSVS